MDVVTSNMKRPPIARHLVIGLVSPILVATGCQQERGTPQQPPPQTTTTTSQPSAAPPAEPPPQDRYQADRIAIKRCCAALKNKVNTVSGDQRGIYAFALGVCDASSSRKGKAFAFAKVQKALGEKRPPNACR